MPRYEQDVPGQRPFRCALTVQKCTAMTQRGIPCTRRSFRVPFCLVHARGLLGVDVRTAPGRGCGLFAWRDFRRGDAIVPYTGSVHRHANIGAALASQGRRSSPYVVQLSHPTRFVDASCTRGYAGYANTPERRGQGPPANAAFQQLTLSAANVSRLSLSGDHRDVWCDLASPEGDLGGIPRQLRSLRTPIRRIPRALLLGAREQSHMWLVATRDIARDAEILVSYGAERDGILAERHRTHPSACAAWRR